MKSHLRQTLAPSTLSNGLGWAFAINIILRLKQTHCFRKIYLCPNKTLTFKIYQLRVWLKKYIKKLTDSQNTNLDKRESSGTNKIL